MKGVVFNLLEEIVSHNLGEDVWEDLLETAKVDGAYTSLGSYPDGDLMKLVGAASSALALPPDDVVQWFGRNALPLLAERYPQFFTPHTSARSFLLTLNDIIHPEVRKLYPGADLPVFDFTMAPDGAIVMGYSSPRKLCSFAEGLIEGAATHYGETVELEQTMCMKRGDFKCVLTISISPAAQAA